MSFCKQSVPRRSLVRGGNVALRLNRQRCIAQNILDATCELNEEDSAQGLVQRRVACDVLQKGFIILHPNEAYFLVKSPSTYPEFQGIFYVVAERFGKLMCSACDERVAAWCLEQVQRFLEEERRSVLENIVTLSQCADIEACRENVVHANILQAGSQQWTLDVCDEERMIYLKAGLVDDPQAHPCWRWSILGGDDLIAGMETLTEDVKEILYLYSAYVAQTKEERDSLDEKVFQAMGDDDLSA